MPNIAFVFPGQGAQYAGMGLALAERYPLAAEYFRRADDALGFSLSTICFEGPEEVLRQTPITQPAILTVSMAYHALLVQAGLVPGMAAGLSLGEYTALAAAGAFEFEDAVRLVHLRGRFMEEAVPSGRGSMLAVMGLDAAAVQAACAEAEAAAAGVVEPANYNCPGQIVVAGELDALERTAAILQARGARRVVPLSVSGPFHCRLLAPAGERLAAELDRVPMKQATIPVISNVGAQPVKDPGEIRAALVSQVSRPVLWEQSVRTMLSMGAAGFVEVGPGKTLSAFIRKIDRQVPCDAVEDEHYLGKVLARGGEVC